MKKLSALLLALLLAAVSLSALAETTIPTPVSAARYMECCVALAAHSDVDLTWLSAPFRDDVNLHSTGRRYSWPILIELNDTLVMLCVAAPLDPAAPDASWAHFSESFINGLAPALMAVGVPEDEAVAQAQAVLDDADFRQNVYDLMDADPGKAYFFTFGGVEAAVLRMEQNGDDVLCVYLYADPATVMALQ